MSNKKKKKNSNYHTTSKKQAAAQLAEAKDARKNKIILAVCSAIILIAVALTITFCAINKKPDTRYVRISVKDHGNIILQLDGKTAPITVDNFMELVNDGFYDGLTFHRILDNFMIQGGCPEGTGSGGNTDKNGKEINIKGEFALNGVNNTLSHERGVISMARSDPFDSASSQFFICNADSPHLDGSYAAFGWVISGLDVVDSVTEEGLKHTSAALNGAIYDKTKQPVITSIVEISEKEALSYVK